MTVYDCVGGCFWVLLHKLCIKLYCGVYEMGNDNGIRFQKNGTEVGRVGCPWTTHYWVLGLLKSVPGCVNWIEIVHVLCA